MMDVMDFLARDYGSVESYLTSIGFGPELQAKMRKTLGKQPEAK